MSLQVGIQKRAGDIVVLTPVGSVDTDTYLVLQKKVDEALRKPVKALVIDLHGVGYMSSMGIKVIINAKTATEKSGGAFYMVSLQPQISKVFDIVKAVPAASIFANMAELDNHMASLRAGKPGAEKGGQ